MNISPIKNSYTYKNQYGTKDLYKTRSVNPSFKLNIPAEELFRTLATRNPSSSIRSQNLSPNLENLLAEIRRLGRNLPPDAAARIEALLLRNGLVESEELLNNLGDEFNAEELLGRDNGIETRANRTSELGRASGGKNYYGIKEVDVYLNEIIKKYSINENKFLKESISFPPPKPNLDYEKAYLRYLSSGSNPNSVFGRVVVENKRSATNAMDSTLLKIMQHNDFDPNERFEDGYNISCTPIFILTTLDKPYLLQEILKLPKANPNITSGLSSSLTPLYRAVSNNILDCAYVLLKSGKVSNSEIRRCKEISDMSPEMRGLLDSYPNMDEFVSKNFKELAELSKVNINTLNDVMTTPNVDPNFIDSNGNNILHIASFLGDDSAVILAATAVNNKVNINCVNKESKSPLQLALEKKQYDLAGYLIDKGADTSKIQDSMQNSFAHIALLIDDEDEAIKLLDCAAEKGANLNAVNMAKVTPCINAVKMRKYKVLNYLINKGVKINAQDMNGMTALHYACMLNDKKSIEILLNNFASRNIKNSQGLTADKYLKQKDLIDFYNMFKTLL